MSIKDLEEKINNNEINDAISIVEKIAEAKNENAVPYLIKLLESTDNHLLRNAISLALSDIGNEEAIEPIIRLLKHSKTKGYRGTLLAALEPFDYSGQLDTLVDFMCKGNFEVSRKSLLLIEAIAEDMSPETRQKYNTIIRDEIDKLQDKINFLSESLNLFAKK